MYAVARRLIELAASALVDTVIAVERALQLREEKIPLALTGGLLLEADLLRTILLAGLEARADYFAPILLVHEPVAGAVPIAVEWIRR